MKDKTLEELREELDAAAYAADKAFSAYTAYATDVVIARAAYEKKLEETKK